MLLAVDVAYDGPTDTAQIGAVLFEDWVQEFASSEFVRTHRGLAPYVPGSFYRRELPCILPLIESVIRETDLSTIIVDGLVDLEDGCPGLGRHLYQGLHPRCRVVGVAKTRFRGAPALEVFRGESARPLWVNASSDSENAAKTVKAMHGTSRIPTLLKRVDSIARGNVVPSQNQG